MKRLSRLPVDPREWGTAEGRRVLLEKAAFAVPAAVVGALTLSVSHSAGAIADLESHRIMVRQTFCTAERRASRKLPE